MGLSKEIILTVKDYEVKLNRDIKFYENDTIDLCFSILEYGIEVKNGVAVNKLMPINALKSYMLIETPQGVDYAESTKVENNRVVFNLGDKYSQFIGIGKMQIVIKDNDGCRVTLPEFPFEIRESINSNWDRDITVLSTEENEIIIDEFGREIALKKISEMEEANILPINSYSMILDNNKNKKIKTNLITQKIENDLQLVNGQLESKANKNEVANGLRAKGKTTYSNLPSSNNNIGDYYYCSDGDGENPSGNYVWNGTTWYFGGTGDDGYNKLNSIIEYTNIGLNSGYIVHSNGKVGVYKTLNCSDFISVLPMSKININLGDFDLNTPDARGLAFYDIDKNYVSGFQYQAGYPIPIIDILVPENCYYLRFTYKNSPILTISTQLTNIVEKCLKVSKINTIDYTDLVKKSITVGAYINATNGKFSLYNDTFSMSEFIPCEENDEITLTIPNKYSDSRGLAFYTENKEFISGVKYGNEKINVTAPTNAKYFAITVIEGFKLIYICNGKQIIRGVDILNPINYKGNEISIFTKCCCIGDSLTKGTFNANNTGTTEYVAIEKYGYPKRLQDLTGVECINLGQGGHTTKSWYELYKNRDLTGYDMAIINLGANDTTANNMTPAMTEEYLQKIIDKMKSSNNGIKIFLATILPAYYNRNTDLYYNINSKIKNVVTNNENCYLVDLSLFSKCRDNTPYAQGHLTALGYNQEANELKSIISYIIKNNMAEFKYVHFINSEHSFN